MNQSEIFRIGLSFLVPYLERRIPGTSVREIADHLLNPAPNEVDSEQGMLRALNRLREARGIVILIVGRRFSGKTVLALRLAEFFDRQTFMISPLETPPLWVERIDLKDIEERVPGGSVLILDDLPAYASSKDYGTVEVRMLERMVPLVRHWDNEKGLALIFSTQSTGLMDKHFSDADAIFVKPLSLLYADTERGAFKRLGDQAMEFFEGMEEKDYHQLVYFFSHEFKGPMRVSMPTQRVKYEVRE